MIALAGASLLLFSVAACGHDAAPGAGTATEATLIGKTFLSNAVTENGKPKQLAPGTRVRLQFTDDGKLVADAGCNSMQAKVSTNDSKLTLDKQITQTLMGCLGQLQSQDGWLSGVLRATPSWKLDGSKLDLTAGSTTISLTDKKVVEPDLSIDGTKWALSSVITGQAASHTAGSEKAWLTLSGERVTGSTGCNDFQGTVARSTGKLTFGELATTRRACAGEPAKLESQLLKGLKGDVTYQVDGSTLKLRSSSGDGLDFTAQR
ncbi:heat shock protein HslJ [Kribbella kalugense]|uniref:Heat shock protein HslJ n=2 Tax=Kribbella kalugense TaxID=2512221 RepID=A0A4R7ZH49_9ACTN|nr:heat shock protein HslJ [Kribbella kalugense]